MKTVPTTKRLRNAAASAIPYLTPAVHRATAAISANLMAVRHPPAATAISSTALRMRSALLRQRWRAKRMRSMLPFFVCFRMSYAVPHPPLTVVRAPHRHRTSAKLRTF